MIGNCKKHVINLECAQDSVDLMSVMEDFSSGAMSNEEFIDFYFNHSRKIRSRGSAIFIQDQQNYYLVTAKHVLENEKTHGIHSPIFRVRSFNELKVATKEVPSCLMNLGAGCTDSQAYTFHDTLDLAIISLNRVQGKKFTEELFQAGYEPMNVSKIYSDNLSEASDVIAIGYPSYSQIAKLNLDQASWNWSSEFITLPILSFGKVSMCHPEIETFLCDISIFPGNSGGGIFFEDKLAGIVVAQPIIPIDDIEASMRIPFAYCVKAKYLIKMLELQKSKDE